MCNAFTLHSLVVWCKENVQCAWDEEKEIEMSRHLICRKNPKKLGDVVRMSYRGTNGYES